MSLSDKNESNLSDHNITLSLSDMESFAPLTQEIQFSSNEMEVEEIEIGKSEIIETEMEKCPLVPEIGAHEIEIETVVSESFGGTLTNLNKSNKVTVVPPLRPLTIAPKPPVAKVPIALKPGAGQQLILVQGGNPGQAIKFLSPQGQSISLTNFGKSVSFKPAVKTVAVSGSQVIQPKQIVMRKIGTTSQIQKISSSADTKTTNIIVAQKSDVGQALKLATNQSGTLISSTSKTITLAQAQQMGLLAGAKIVTQPVAKQAVFLNKSQNKPVKIMPQGNKFPAKILPAPQVNANSKGTQRIILKQAGGSTTLLPSQIIQVAGAQGLATGQLHPINIPGKGIQYIKFVTATTSSETITSSTITTAKIASQTVTSGSKLIAIATSNTPSKVTGVLTEVKNMSTNVVPKATKVVATSTLRPAEINPSSTTSSPQLLMLPANLIRTSHATPKVPIPAKPPATKLIPPNDNKSTPSTIPGPLLEATTIEPNGMRPRKPCNCTKSQCLKLYCDCFANGEFCYMCNCMNCFNNLENEEHRQLAIKSCLERNPHAFRPKIGKARDVGTDMQVRKHTKGCHCKRSGCLKNYCECYEAKIPCSGNCKCFGCRNIENSVEKKANMNTPISTINMSSNVSHITPKANASKGFSQIRPKKHTSNKHAFSLITDDVIEITTQCLLTISNTAEVDSQNEEVVKQQIIVEFGRCLQEIISHSSNRLALH